MSVCPFIDPEECLDNVSGSQRSGMFPPIPDRSEPPPAPPTLPPASFSAHSSSFTVGCSWDIDRFPASLVQARMSFERGAWDVGWEERPRMERRWGQNGKM